MSGKPFSIETDKIQRERSVNFSHLYTDTVLVMAGGDQVQIFLGIHTPTLEGIDVVGLKAIDHHAIIMDPSIARKLAGKLIEIASVIEDRKKSPPPASE